MEDKSAAALKVLAELGYLDQIDVKPEFADVWPKDEEEEFLDQVQRLFTKDNNNE